MLTHRRAQHGVDRRACAIPTTTTGEPLEPTDDRQPVVLGPDEAGQWPRGPGDAALLADVLDPTTETRSDLDEFT